MFPEQNKPSDEPLPLFDSRKELQEDGWAESECLQHCKYQKYVSFLSMFISLPLIISPFWLYSSYSIDIAIVLGTFGILSLVTGFLSFLWSVQYLKSNDRTGLSKMGSLLFFLIVIVLLAFLGSFMVAKVMLESYRNELIAQGSQTIASFNTEINTFTWILVVFFMLLLLAQGYCSFALYICAVNETFNRILLNLFLTLFLLFNLSLIYLSTQITDLLQTRALQHYVGSWCSNASLSIGVIGTLLSFICLFVNLRRYRVVYFVIGSLLLIFVVIGVVFAGLVHRQADGIQASYEANCLVDMKSISLTDLEAQGCPSKYLTKKLNKTTVYDLNCPQNQTALVWELDSGKTISQKSDTLACLNINCCQLLGNVYSLWFYGLAFCFLGMSLLAFCCICCLFYLSLKTSIGKNSTLQLDYFFWALMILMLVTLALMTQFYQAENLGQEQTQVTSFVSSKNDLQFKDSTYNKVFSAVGKICDTFYNQVYNKSDYQEMIKIEQNNNSAVLRLAIEGNGSFQYDFSENSVKIKFFENSYQSMFFPNGGDQGFVLFEGSSSDVDSFLKNNLLFCMDDYAESPQFSYVKYVYYKNSSNVTSVSTIQKNIKIHRKTAPKTKENSSSINKKKHRAVSTYFEISQQAEKTLDSYRFSSPSMFVFDSDTAQPVSTVLLSLYKSSSNDTCQDTFSGSVFRTGTTSDTGSVLFSNLVIMDYFLIATAENYKRNCQKIPSASVFEAENVYIVLVREFNDKAFRVLLFWNNDQLLLSLQAGFNYNQQEECMVGYFQASCGNMYSNGKLSAGSLTFQTVDIYDIGSYDYLFYVQKVPQGSQLDFYELEQANKLSNTPTGINNTDFYDSEPFIQVYSKEMGYPREDFYAPRLGQGDVEEPDLIWLAFCMNGTVGEVAEREVGQYWTKVASNASYYQRLSNQTDMLPDSSICNAVL